MDSSASPKVKTTEGEGVGACSLACNTLRVERHVGALGWTKKIDKQFTHSHGPTQTK